MTSARIYHSFIKDEAAEQGTEYEVQVCKYCPQRRRLYQNGRKVLVGVRVGCGAAIIQAEKQRRQLRANHNKEELYQKPREEALITPELDISKMGVKEFLKLRSQIVTIPQAILEGELRRATSLLNRMYADMVENGLWTPAMRATGTFLHTHDYEELDKYLNDKPEPKEET